MDVLLDTNILVRCIEPNHPHHQSAKDAVATLAKRADRLCLVPQILYEYFVTCTRPQQENGGLGMSNPQAINEVRRIQSLFEFLPDPPDLYARWLHLVEQYAVMGKRAHDARIAAVLTALRIPAILTFNVRDFRRYSEITVLEPTRVAAAS